MSWTLPLWRTGYVKPLVRYVVPHPDNLSLNPPGTGTLYPTPSADADGIGVFLANWVHYFTDQFALNGRVFSDYCVCPSSIGTSNDGVARYVFGYSPDDDVLGATATKTAWGPLSTAGASFNLAQMTDAMASLKSELDARGLDYPHRLEYDGEKKPNIFRALPVSDGGPGQGWLAPLIDGTEPRGGTVLIDGSSTFLDLWDARAKGDGTSPGFAYNASLGITASDNRLLYGWLDDAVQRIRDAAFKSAIYTPAKAAFPGLRCSNYEQSARKRGTRGTGDYPWHDIEYDYIADIDVLSPVFYPLPQSAIGETSPARVSDWLEALGLASNGDTVLDLRAITVAKSKAAIDSILATGTSKQIAPWIPSLDYRETLPAFLGGGTWRLEAEDIEEIVLHCISAGVREFFVFWGDAPATPEAIAAFTTLVSDANSLQAQLAPDEPTEGEEMALGTMRTAPAGLGGGNGFLLRISGSTPWDTVISAGGLVTADASTITNPTTQVTSQYNRVIRRDGRTPGVLELRLGYAGGLTYSANLKVKVFGRHTADDKWAIIPNRAGSSSATLSVAGVATDLTDGTLKYTTVDSYSHCFDCHGYDQVLIGVETALATDIGSPTTAILQYKFTDRPSPAYAVA